jgi:predicted RND superfamily exporter protein
MSPQLSRTDRAGIAVADLAIRHPWRVITAAVLVALIVAAGATNLRFSNNYRTFFSSSNPELIAFEELQATYTKNDNILFVLKPAGGDVFNSEVLTAVDSLTEQAWQIPFAIRVDSVTNFQHSWSEGDELTVEDLVRDPEDLTTAEIGAKRDIALGEPLLEGFLVARDGTATGVNVTLQYPEESLSEVPEAAAHARELAARIETEHPDLEVAITGVSMLNNSFAEAGFQDMFTLVPLMYLVLILVMAVTLRSVVGTVVTLLVVVLSTATAMGIAGYLGMRIDPISATAPTIILTLAIADSVHILVTVLSLMSRGHDKLSALRESLRINLLAVSITSLTTIVGFLSLNFSDAPPFRILGDITAVGIGAAWLYSLTFMPALIRVLPLRVRLRAGSRSNGVLTRLADVVTRRHRPILWTTAAVAIGLTAVIPTLELDDRWIQYFDERVEFRRDAEFALDHLTGLYLVDYSLEAGGPEQINSPDYLRELDRFTVWLREQPEVLHVYSYADVIRRLNRNMHGDDPVWYRLPEERELAAQYLLLYELSLPYGLDLNDRISVDKSATRVTATMKDMSTVEVRAFLDRSSQWLGQRELTAVPTGPTAMFSYISKRNIESMLRGNVVERGTCPHDLRYLGAAGRADRYGRRHGVGDVARHHRRQHGALPQQVRACAPREGARPSRLRALRLRHGRPGDRSQLGDPGLRLCRARTVDLQGQRRDGAADRDRRRHRTGRGLPLVAFTTDARKRKGDTS